MHGESRHHQTVWHYQGKCRCRHWLISPHDGEWQCQPPPQWYHYCLKGEWVGDYLHLPCIWTCLPPPMVGPLLKIWRSQCKVSPNLKDLIWGLLLWYSPSSWWHISPFLVNLHYVWWMRRFLEPPSSPPENLSLQAPSPPPSPYSMCLANFTWLVHRGATSVISLGIWPHVRAGGARFVALWFVNFFNFRDSAYYVVAHAGLSELSCFY